jgi:hypothetical protein
MVRAAARIPLVDLDSLLFPQTEIHNLDGVVLSKAEQSVLALNLKFIPAPKPLPPTEAEALAKDAQSSLFYRLKLRTVFFGHPDRCLPRFRISSGHFDFSEHNDKLQAIYCFIDALKNRLVTTVTQQSSKALLQAIVPTHLLATVRRLQLRCRKDLVVKTTDKNLGVAVMSHAFYRAHVHPLLTAPKYTPVLQSSLAELKQVLATKYQRVIDPGGKLSNSKSRPVKDLFNFLSQKSQVNLFDFQKFQGLPKVHKPVLAFRPVQSYREWIAQPLASYLSAVLQPFLRRFPSICKDSASLVRTLSKQALPPGVKACTADVVNLYPSIPQDDLLALLRGQMTDIHAAYAKEPGAQLPYGPDQLYNLFEFIVTTNYVKFDGNVFEQREGIPTGANCSVELSNFWLSVRETPLLQDTSHLFFYTRYIDDLLVLALPGFDHERFASQFNSLHERLRVTFSPWGTRVEFLDVVIDVATAAPMFSVHQKVLNKYLYIPRHSLHEPHMFSGFMRAELLRYLLRSSTEADFIAVRELFYLRLLKRGYHERSVLEVFTRVQYSDREALLQEPPPKVNRAPPPVIVLPFNANFEHLNPRALLQEAFADLEKSGVLQWYPKELEQLRVVLDEVRVAWSTERALGDILTSPI